MLRCSGSPWLLFALFLFALNAASSASAQAASSAAASAPAAAISTERDLRFDTASVRPGGPPTGMEYRSGGVGYTPGRYRRMNMSLTVLLYEAFDKPHQYFKSEYPHWMDSAYFSVIATVPQGATKADVPVMLQHLLEDRFALKYHHETREVPGYELVVVKPGKLAKAAAPAMDGAKLSGGIEVKDGVPQFKASAGSGQLCYSAGCVWRGRNRTMHMLAEDMEPRVNAPVIDKTGLEGGYDYTLTWNEPVQVSGGRILSPMPPPPAPTAGSNLAPAAEVPAQFPLLRDALVEQLGVKLVPIKQIPIDVIVIDSINREPTPN